MELTYTAEWSDNTADSSTLTVATYDAHVYRTTARGRYTWLANHTAEDTEGEFGSFEIGRGRADSKEDGQRAVETAIREHHAKEQ